MCEHMKKDVSGELNPTLWRTCRVLANHTRLKLFQYVLFNPRTSVHAVAAALKIKPALASKYLRELNARGLLHATRLSANVFYHVQADQSVPGINALVKALINVLKSRTGNLDHVYRKATAFTHPRRVDIAKRLRYGGPASPSDLSRELTISIPALQRHLRKLASRGFLEPRTPRSVYTLIEKGTPLEMALLRQ